MKQTFGRGGGVVQLIFLGASKVWKKKLDFKKKRSVGDPRAEKM